MGQRRNHKEIRRYFALVEDANKTYQNEWGVSQAVLRGKFLAFNNGIGKRRKVLK